MNQPPVPEMCPPPVIDNTFTPNEMDNNERFFSDGRNGRDQELRGRRAEFERNRSRSRSRDRDRSRSRNRSITSDNLGVCLPSVVEELAQMVAVSGDVLDSIARDRNNDTAELGFLNDKYSSLYRSYRARVEEIKQGLDSGTSNDESHKNETVDTKDNVGEPKRKRKSRWGDKDDSVAPPPTVTLAPSLLGAPGVAAPSSLGAPGVVIPTALGGNVPTMAPATPNTGLTPARQANPSLLAYAQRVFGSVDLDEAQWKQCEDQLKVNSELNV